MSICRLCHEDRELLRSHIIPEFCHKDIYDEKGRIHELSTDPAVRNRHDRQKGIRERLLCGECEQRLSVWEKHASQFLNGKAESLLRSENRVERVDVLDYKKFKLFQLSLLWRAGVASDEKFERVRLNKHEEILRRMILRGDPGSPCDYGCVVALPFMKIEGQDKYMPHIVIDYGRMDARFHYKFALCGFYWYFIVSSHNQSYRLKDYFLKQDGTLVIPKLDVRKSRSWCRLVDELENQGKLTKYKSPPS